MPLDLFGPTVPAGGVTARPGETRLFTAQDTFFKDCSSPDLDDGTEFQAAWFNSMLGVLRGLARGNGQTLTSSPVIIEDNADDAILLKAVQHLAQRGQPLYAEDTSSTPNVLIASLSPAPAEYIKGMTVAVKANTSNTGATTLNLNGLNAKAVVRPNGGLLLDSDISAGSVNSYRYDGTKFQLLGASAKPDLKRNTTLYVNGTIGNDNNDGIANDATHALATIQGAVNLAFRYGPSPFVITILIAPGSYAGAITPLWPGPSLTIDGQVATSVIVDGSIAPNVSSYQSFVVQGPNTVTVRNLTVQNAGAAGSGGALMSTYGATLNTVNTRSNATGGAVFEAYQGGSMLIGSHTFNGNCYAAFYSLGANIQLLQGAVYTIATPLTLTIAFAWATSCGNIGVPGTSPPTFVNAGTVTGPKYAVSLNGIIAISGNGASYFPGSSAGGSATGGQYA